MEASSTGIALVLGGGGVTGIGWEVGFLMGLLDDGVDVRNADLVIGTSAGSFVGANYAGGADWNEVFEDQSVAGSTEPEVTTAPEVFAAWQEAFRAGGGDARAVGQGFGRVARKFPAAVSPEVRLGAVRRRLKTGVWPSNLRITTVDAATGDLWLMGPDDGVPLETATAASGAVPGVWPSVEINGRDYFDGGMVSPANSTLAAGHDTVLVLAPMYQGYAGVPSTQDEVESIRDHSTVRLVIPDDSSRAAIGENPYDASRAGKTAEAGRAQGRTMSARIAEMMRG